ncbi:MAG: hypothetical protein JSW66_09210 [Phycisphaerales bacterium]|nr:MAG: hypothetical protein JSW66_09210 [Phycisphaerales bacterium]
MNGRDSLQMVGFSSAALVVPAPVEGGAAKGPNLLIIHTDQLTSCMTWRHA